MRRNKALSKVSLKKSVYTCDVAHMCYNIYEQLFIHQGGKIMKFKIHGQKSRAREKNRSKIALLRDSGAGQKIPLKGPFEAKMDTNDPKITKNNQDVKFPKKANLGIIYDLEGLSCGSCAIKLEKKLKKLNEVEDAQVDFKNAKVKIKYDEKNFELIKKIVNDVDNNLKIFKNEKVENKNKKNYQPLIFLFISSTLVLSTYLISMSTPIKIFIFCIAYLIVGYDILIKLIKNLFKLELFDENFLMGLATIAAFLIGEYTEAIAVIIFYKLGMFLQNLAVTQSRQSISELMDIKPEFANLEIKKNYYKIVDPQNVKINDTIIVKPGEKIPLDGTIIDGKSFVDNKALTGESRKVKVQPGSNVLSGAINNNNLIKIKVTKEYQDSTVAKILDLLENSSMSKAPTENFITKFARIYTPVVVMLALLVAIIPPLTFSGEPFNIWIYRAVVFLVISCPCALVISIPLGYFAGVGNASQNGILVKGANYLEALNNVESVVIDKTGTLTHGNFKVSKVHINRKSNITKKELLKTAAYAEQFSNHPIAYSIKESFKGQVDPKVIKDYQEVPGQGIKAQVKNDTILAGNYAMMAQNKVDGVTKIDNKTIVYLAKNREYLGYLIVEDEIRADSVQGLNELKALGVKNLIMLTGDDEIVAQDVAERVGVDKYFAKLLPTDKVKQFDNISQTKDPSKNLIFVGDGLNDAPVLAKADIGIAMGGIGSDAAIEAADVVIMNDEILKIPLAMRIARKTQRIVKENIVLSITIKVLAMLLGILGVATIWEAVIADVGVAIVAILNATRVLNTKN